MRSELRPSCGRERTGVQVDFLYDPGNNVPIAGAVVVADISLRDHIGRHGRCISLPYFRLLRRKFTVTYSFSETFRRTS